MISVAALLLAAAAGFAYASPLLRMSPAPTGAVGDTGILALHGGLNSLYFIPVEDGYILVDAGSGADKVAQSLGEVGVDPREVRHILLTHSDSDHVAALALFPNARIYMGSAEAQMVNGTTRHTGFSSNSLPEGVSAAEISLVEDGQRISPGGREVTCLSVPGHTPGSTAYLLDGQYLFTGDAFQVRDGAMSVHPYTMDGKAAAESIQKLAEAMEEAGIILTAHYGWYPADSLR